MDENIEKLPFSPAKKSELQWIQDNVAGMTLFSPVMKTNAPKSPASSWWAFFFQGLTYLFKGMVKKGIALILIQLGLYIALGIVFGVLAYLLGGDPGTVGSPSALIVNIVMGIYCMRHYKYDFYRRHVKGEDFWL